MDIAGTLHKLPGKDMPGQAGQRKMNRYFIETIEV